MLLESKNENRISVKSFAKDDEDIDFACMAFIFFADVWSTELDWNNAICQYLELQNIGERKYKCQSIAIKWTNTTF